MSAVRHYCHTCKQQVPLAPGTVINDYFTVGVAHIKVTTGMHQEIWTYVCPDPVRRTYVEGEQVRNLLEMDLCDES